jgi:hypothetical protein
MIPEKIKTSYYGKGTGGARGDISLKTGLYFNGVINLSINHAKTGTNVR